MFPDRDFPYLKAVLVPILIVDTKLFCLEPSIAGIWKQSMKRAYKEGNR